MSRNGPAFDVGGTFVQVAGLVDALRKSLTSPGSCTSGAPDSSTCSSTRRPPLALCPQTMDVKLARTWFDELAVAGAEGLVIKDLAGVYRIGGRGPSWWKYKRKVTVEAIIGGIIGAIEGPRALLLAASTAAAAGCATSPAPCRSP